MIWVRPARPVQKQKSRAAEEILARLREYLDGNCAVPVEILCGFWENQQDAITYQELREAVKAGSLEAAVFREWSQDYSNLVTSHLKPMWERAMQAGSMSQPVMQGLSFKFDTQTPGIMKWITERGAEFVTSASAEQKAAIAALLSKKMIDRHTVDELARLIRPCIGLTKGQAEANARYYDSIVAQMKKDHPRMKEESIRRKAREAAAKYAEKQHRGRAMTIAQTEMAFAYNRGADEGIRQAQAHGLMGGVKKRWCTSGDDRVCDICQAFEGMEIEMDKGFPFKGRSLFSGQDLLPPAHPRCACAVEYIEIEEAPGNSFLGAGSSDGMTEGNVKELGEIAIEDTDSAMSYYNEQLRYRDTEQAVIIDKNGVVYYSEGDDSGVSFGGLNLSGATITHNHPSSNGIVSFGKDDFEFLKKNQDIKKLIAVNKIYTYTVQVLSDISEVSYDEYYYRALEGITDIMSFDEDLQHIVFEILDEEGFVRYVRKKVHR